MQNTQVKTMNRNLNSSWDSGVQRQCKKARKDEGSNLSSQGQNINVKDKAAEKEAYPLGLDTSSELTPTMHGCDPEARSTHVDSHPSHQYLMSTSAYKDDKGDLDLYRAEEEIKEEQQMYQSKSADAVGESQSSVSASEDIQTYSEREWKGNTSKSRLIRKGYDTIAKEFTLCVVRGDNYCALRATLFQVLSQSKQLPVWLSESNIIEWPKQVNSDGDLIKDWRFPLESRKSKVEMLEQCLDHLRKRWQEAVQCKSLQERERMCQLVFVGQKEEYELLEALKFLMLRTAIQLHADMTKGSDVPEFCWLLFARDSSKCPKSLLTNHLRHVGFNGGLEQVEMCLLGHSLQQTIQVHRLYKSDTEEFITFYPNDHREDWPALYLLTEDDRHYNALVPKRDSKFDEHGRPKWNEPSERQTHKTTNF